MTRMLRTIFIVAALSQCLTQAQVPSVDKVLQRFVTALGGKDELERIHTMILRGTMELPDFKASGTTVEYFEYPDRFAAITEIQGHYQTRV